MIRFGLVAAVSVGIAAHLSVWAEDVRFPLFTCSTDYQSNMNVARIDCQRPHEVLDVLQTQLETLRRLRADWESETLCGRQYRKALEWSDADRPSLLRYAQNLLNECNRAGLSYAQKLSAN
jgi:hypothetical protein